MGETASASTVEEYYDGNGAAAPGRRLLRRPTTSETERIHMRCGELDGAVAQIRPGEWHVWFTCTCGGRIARLTDDD